MLLKPFFSLLLVFFMFCAQIPFSFEPIFPFFPLGRPNLRPVLGCQYHNFLETCFSLFFSSYSSCFVLRFLSQLCVLLFIFLFDCPSFHPVFVCQCHNFLVVPRKSCMFVSFLFLQLVLSFIVLSNNQNPTSALRDFISDFCNICVRVNWALSSLQTHFKFCIHQSSLENFNLSTNECTYNFT